MSDEGTVPEVAVPAPALTPTPAPNVIVQLPDEAALSHGRHYAYSTWVPSMGHLYGGRFPGGEVIFSPITTAEEKILGSQKDDRSEILDLVIQRCIIKMPVPYEELLLPDMLYLLFAIRNVTYGADYKFTIKCSSCRQDYVKRITLPNDLELRVLGEDDTELNEVVLPRCKRTVKFRPLRVKDETEVRKWTKKQYSLSLQDGDPAYQYRMAKHIVEIDGVAANMIDRLALVERLIGDDSLRLKRAFEKHDFGCKMKFEAECSACGKREQARIPLDREFFQPGDESGEG